MLATKEQRDAGCCGVCGKAAAGQVRYVDGDGDLLRVGNRCPHHGQITRGNPRATWVPFRREG